MDKLKNKIKPTTLLWLLFGAWWVVNLLQAGFTELANDEAYYVLFAQKPDWGYFDHPPMTAILVWLGSFFGGEFGVRFFFTLLQPAYLLIFFYTIKPKEITTSDAVLYFVICAAQPILQLYGFIAVPDGPLMLATSLFLLCYKRFTQDDSWLNTLLIGATAALLAYSKYHGALVILFILLSNLRLFKNYKVYLAAVIALILIIPHLMWQAEHDWASFQYHLSGRNKIFRWSYVTDFLLNMVAVFNPLYFPPYIKAWLKTKSQNPTERALYFILAGFLLFFTFSSVRGYVQPQWVIPITFSLIMILFNYTRRHTRTRKYVVVSGLVTVGLILLTRIIMIFNPTGIKYEIFDNKPSYGAIEEVANGRTVIFSGSYAIASKYIYYTDGAAYSQPHVDYRSSHWQFLDQDTRATGQQVLVETRLETPDSTIHMANGRTFSYKVVGDFKPVRKIFIDTEFPGELTRGQQIDIEMSAYNPYPYPVELSPDSVSIQMVWKDKRRNYFYYTAPTGTTIDGVKENPESAIKTAQSLGTWSFTIPEELAPGPHTVGLTIKPAVGSHWFNSKQFKVEVK